MSDRNFCYVNATSDFPDEEIAAIVAANQEDVNQYGALWGLGRITLRQVPKGDPPLAGWEQQVFTDNADVAGALGYHDLTAEGLPMGHIFTRTTLRYGSSVSRVANHELWEELVDPDLNRYTSSMPDGREYCVEVGDLLSLDSQGRDSPSGVMLSGIALPACYYAGYGSTKYDIGGLLTAPLPYVQPEDGAYLMWRGGSAWAGTAAAMRPHYMQPPLVAAGDANGLMAMMPQHGSRRYRRILGKAHWRKSTVAVR